AWLEITLDGETAGVTGPGTSLVVRARGLTPGTRYAIAAVVRGPGGQAMTSTGTLGLRGTVDAPGVGIMDVLARPFITSAQGRIVSSAPARVPRAGVSVVRADDELSDEDPAAWDWDAEGGSTPGGPNRRR